MHPCLYEYQLAPSYKLRDRSRRGQEVDSEKMSMQTQVRSESPSATQSNVDKNPGAEGREDGVDSQLLGTSDLSTTDSPLDKYAARCISWRPRFKAEVQEWTGVTSESDPKWLGTRIWPLEKMEQRYLIERDPIGKGRQDSCGCELPGSIECVRFHIAEKRLRVKLELGSAFYHWKFEKMGEEVKLSWTKEQEEKFKGALRSNTSSLQTFFWDQNFKFLPTKSRADLVSYYFNVFLLERRAYQNRFTPNVIYSDDEELESGLVSNATGNEEDRSPSSIFYSPKKPYTKSR
ncbi:AT-rich interactive domain-containing protein 1 [Morella rubra]|uniref:AT-rich interactive domain-containing protein 1 n=1 Tax=Morella rubra TaxID=262757 RepID=A0A6A1VNU7_9ROSI|nr:AT-rich interactive domain-containing protein 1 [Morella rubra]